MIFDKYKSQLNWLLQGDASVQYFTHRDLLNSPENKISEIQTQINNQGLVKKLLDLQDDDGKWAQGLYSPKWTSTTYTLLLLSKLGATVNENIKKACFLLLNEGVKENGGFTLWKSRKDGEVCVTGILLSVFSHFNIQDARVYSMADYLIQNQMPDGGWNCENLHGATHSSFHTTMLALEGLWVFQKTYNTDVNLIKQCQDEAIEFMAEHHLYKSHRTGKTVDQKMTRLSFPNTWRYDIIRFLDYASERNIPKDARFKDAIDIVEKKQTKDGFWKLPAIAGKKFFNLEEPGKPSRLATLRSLRTLKWWYKI